MSINLLQIELPIEVQVDIFQRLDQKSLLAARVVCCEWYHLATESQSELLKSIVNKLVKGVKPIEDKYLTTIYSTHDANTILINKANFLIATKFIITLESVITSVTAKVDCDFLKILEWDAETLADSLKPYSAFSKRKNQKWIMLTFSGKGPIGSAPFYTASGKCIYLSKNNRTPVYFPLPVFQNSPPELFFPLYGRVLKVILDAPFYAQLSMIQTQSAKIVPWGHEIVPPHQYPYYLPTVHFQEPFLEHVSENIYKVAE